MTLLSQRREVGEFRKRYKWMALAVLGSFAVLLARVVQLQLIEHEEWARVARENITKTIVLPATRGIIRDARGRIVATNRPSYDVYVTPQLLDPSRDVARIAELLGLDTRERAEFEERLARIPARRRTHQIEMFTDITREQLAAIETHGNELPGVDVVAVPVRSYPFGSLGAHAVGYLNEVSAEDIARHEGQGYRAGDQIGRTGMEHAWEGYLRGRRGFRRVLVDVRGHEQDVPPTDSHSNEPMHREPVPGRDLTLALDMELMQSIERAFRGHPSGAAVVVDARTGRVRALFSKPAYDLNEMSGRLSPDRFRELNEDPFRPLIDKTLYESYFPGSTFKPISALAALGDHVLDPSQRVECVGFYTLGNRRFRCTQSHGEVDMRKALVRSCNVYFYKLAEQVGIDRLARYANMFGLGTPTGIGINSEAGGTITTREWYERQGGSARYRLGFALNAAIGQGNTRATLLQLAMAYGAIANGGTLYVPQIVERVSGPDGSVIEEFEPRIRRRVSIDAAHLAFVIDGLFGVVNEEDGSAFESRIDGGVPVAGKTGTAQIGRRRPRPDEDPRRAWFFNRSHAWFAGFAPANDPEVVIIVLVEHGGAGGRNAAPIAMQVLQDYLGGRVTARADAPLRAGILARTATGGR